MTWTVRSRRDAVIDAVATGTLDVAIRAACEAWPDSRIVAASDERPRECTLGELGAQALQLAAWLQHVGIGPGDTVAMALPNWLEGLVCQAAALLSGAAILPILPNCGPREIAYMLTNSGAAVLVMPTAFRGRDYRPMLEELGMLQALRQIVLVGDEVPEAALPWDAIHCETSTFTPPVIDPLDPAVVVYTSGTTAAPKGVQHTHRSILAETFSPVVADGAGPRTSHLCVFPSGHVAALSVALRILVHGTPTVLMDVWNPQRAAAVIDQYAITATAGAPVHLAGLLDARDRGHARLDSLRLCTVGGANVPAALIARAEAAGVVACRTYGLSEHPTITAIGPEDPFGKRASTDGRVLPGNQVRIVDDSDRDVAAGLEGNILSRGAELFSGYRDAALDRDAFVDGWFRTGDVGRLDTEGYLTVTDRKKDLIIRGGENISSREVEEILASHPRVSEVAAVGAPDERLGERVAVFVVLLAGETLELAEVAAHFQETGSARHKTPEIVRVVSELPRTAAGKVRKRDLQAVLAAEHRYSSASTEQV